MTHSDYRRFARDTLRGRWPAAVLAGLLTSLLGGETYEGPKLEFNLSEGELSAGVNVAGQTFNFGEGFPSVAITGGVMLGMIFAFIMALALFAVGSAVRVGYFRYHLNLADGKPAAIGDLFVYFPHLVNLVLSRLLRAVYAFLWMLLLIIPGIIATYRYRMTDFLLAEDPTLAPDEAISRSKELMDGRKFDLFVLDLSFIGWDLLCILTLGIGYLWLNPYKQASYTAFYRSLTMSGYENLMSSN